MIVMAVMTMMMMITGLSLRGRGWGFSPAAKNVALGYFHRKVGEK